MINISILILERPQQSLPGKMPAEIYWGREVAWKAA